MTALVGLLCPAQLMTKDGSKTLDFHYNPGTLTLTKTANWQKAPRRGARDAAPPQFLGSEARTLDMTLLFDEVEDPRRSVRDAVDTLHTWLTATDESWNNHKPQPPTLHLSWGRQRYLTGYLKSVVARYTLFAPEGTPLRASVDVTIEEVPDPPKPTNPTSGGVAGRRAVRAVSGDSLPSLARQEYGDPNLWRALARANGIDDPSRLRPGTALLVPPLAEARDLAGTRRG